MHQHICTSLSHTHLHFSFSHHKTRNLFTCSCFSSVHRKEEENAPTGVSLCYVKPIFELLPRMYSCKLRECSYSPRYRVYDLLRELFWCQLGHSLHKQELCKVSKRCRMKCCTKKYSVNIQVPCVPQQHREKCSSRQH